jgi:hypothetical protein
MNVVVSACMVTSAVAQAATFVIYTVIPDGKSLHGQTLRCQFASLCLCYIFLFVARVFTKAHLKFGFVCKAVGEFCQTKQLARLFVYC